MVASVTHYSLRAIAPDEAIIQFYECEYTNALDALEAAKCLLSDGSVEVWSANTRIASVRKGEPFDMPEPGD
jgi:hypothetical protein